MRVGSVGKHEFIFDILVPADRPGDETGVTLKADSTSVCDAAKVKCFRDQAHRWRFNRYASASGEGIESDKNQAEPHKLPPEWLDTENSDDCEQKTNSGVAHIADD
jgi:hypothetical protein